MLLTKSNLPELVSLDVELPSAESFDLPEKVIQFGTGMLLRGLPDYFIDKANKRQIFNGRVLVVKSTGNSGTDIFDQQDSLYTLSVKGIDKGNLVEKYSINNSISRVLSANRDWEKILEAAADPELQIVVSNTTEVGIVSSWSDVKAVPPDTFPGKLLAFLYQRYQAFNGDEHFGMVILPTELIPDNGGKLKEIILDLSDANNLGNDFKNWLENANHFCNTLVDRIVVGMSSLPGQHLAEGAFPFEDNLMIMAEPFKLWAIETDSDRVKNILSFAQADSGIVLTPSIEKFKQLKLRLLNATHTLSCGVALLSGFQTVKEAMADNMFSEYVKNLMGQEIGPAILDDEISKEDIQRFSAHVVERFSNPFLAHKWQNIALNYTAKMKMRVVGLLSNWYEKSEAIPLHFALGFAVYLKFMQSTIIDGKYTALSKANAFELQDEHAAMLYNYWQNPDTVVRKVLQDENLWGEDLTRYRGFEERIDRFLKMMEEHGLLATVKNMKENGI